MFNVIDIEINAFVQHLQQAYHRTYGGSKPDYADIIGWAGNMALENIANSDALYHNTDHTILVTLVGQEILRGKHIREGGVTAEDWLHFAVSLLCHDIGYVKGVCQADQSGQYATGEAQPLVALPAGATDAALTPYHVDRGKLFVKERRQPQPDRRGPGAAVHRAHPVPGPGGGGPRGDVEPAGLCARPTSSAS